MFTFQLLVQSFSLAALETTSNHVLGLLREGTWNGSANTSEGPPATYSFSLVERAPLRKTEWMVVYQTAGRQTPALVTRFFTSEIGAYLYLWDVDTEGLQEKLYDLNPHNLDTEKQMIEAVTRHLHRSPRIGLWKVQKHEVDL